MEECYLNRTYEAVAKTAVRAVACFVIATSLAYSSSGCVFSKINLFNSDSKESDREHHDERIVPTIDIIVMNF